jgi:hypothetical protein
MNAPPGESVNRIEPVFQATTARTGAIVAFNNCNSEREMSSMTGLEVSVGSVPKTGCTEMCPESSRRSDAELCDQLKAYLACRSRNVDPPPKLVQAWDDFYDFNTPRIRRLLLRCGFTNADQDDCLQDVWSEVIAHLE